MASILLDQNVSHRLRHLLAGHDVRTAFYKGWSDLVDGDLIAAAEAADLDVTVTAGKNLRHQQNLAGGRLALVVIESNNSPLVRRHADLIARAISLIGPGGFREVAFRAPRPAPPATPS